MKGAGEYYYPIVRCYEELGLIKMNEGYYGNHLFFHYGEHARGKELYIYIIPDENELKGKGLYGCEHIKIYGVVSGDYGWTESYGFILHGKWEAVCKEILEKSIHLYKEKVERIKEQRQLQQKAERQDIIDKAKSYECLFE